ncbi:predicted protein [Plenodomus lingam JN3]|uniref:Predicted protein n=1 Tax=Leptosphaeria maculans (strain JN3 / isolate v23.1.3 / race Av1-4-5-6-7-8) TaxID=985895 RepID=E5A133_LEPMJ|nr:predicted protein [Plenodomus lingam JN3]CBX97329.1 predicted protein [Plenodomus lingam JN3]
MNIPVHPIYNLSPYTLNMSIHTKIVKAAFAHPISTLLHLINGIALIWPVAGLCMIGLGRKV